MGGWRDLCAQLDVIQEPSQDGATRVWVVSWGWEMGGWRDLSIYLSIYPSIYLDTRGTDTHVFTRAHVCVWCGSLTTTPDLDRPYRGAASS